MLGGIEGVMNLAAASGEDLGMVADIVTDGLTAFGLAAEESARFSDVLASAASNSNTNVSMLGESFKYVAPVAGSLGYTIEDTAVALGLMANAGIKSSQAGTALRSTLSRMVNPVENTEKAMKALNISMVDSKGEMKPLNVLIGDLRKAFSNLTEAEKASYASMLGGQEAMSGLLAIVNASESDFNKLTEAIHNSAGTAEEMAEIKLDNLKGQVTLLKSSFEATGIAVYQKFAEPMKSGVKSAISSVNSLTKSVNKGGLGSALEGLGKQVGILIADFAKFATKALPPLIDGFSWLIKNIGALTKIVVASVAAFKTFSIITAVTKAMDSFNVAMTLAGVSTKITTVAQLGKVAADQAEAVSVGLATTALTAKGVILGVLTGKISLATAAQHLFNAALWANPAGIMTAAIVALTVAFGAWVIMSDQATEEEKARQEAIDETIQKTNELTEAVKEQNEAYLENLDMIAQNAQTKIIELDKTKELADELLNLADTNGKVAESDKDRAAVILNDINSALGTEYKLIDNQIQGYNKLTEEIYKNIEAEKARIVIKAHEDMYAEAMKREAEAKKEAEEATKELKNAESGRAEIIESVRQQMEQMTGQTVTQEEAQRALTDSHFVASQGVRESFEKQKKSYDELGAKIDENKKTIENYGQVCADTANLEMELSAIKLAAEKGNMDELMNTLRVSAADRKAIQEANGAELVDLIIKNNETIKFLEEQKETARTESERNGWQSAIDTANEKGKLLQEEYQKTNANIDTNQVEHLENMVKTQSSSLEKQLQDAKGNKIKEQEIINSHYIYAKQQLSDYATQYGIGTKGYTKEGLAVLEAHVNDMEKKYGIGMDEIIDDTQQMGVGMKREMGNSGRNGMGELNFELGFARPYIKSNVGDTGSQAATEFKEKFDGNKLGKDSADGVISGINSKLVALGAAGGAMGNAVQGGYKSTQDQNSPSKAMRKLARFDGDGLILGYKDKMGELKDAAAKLAMETHRPFEEKPKFSLDNIEIPEKFFGVGVNSAEEFAKGFNEQFARLMSDVKMQVNATLASITPHVTPPGGSGGNSNTTYRTTTNSPTLIFNEPVNSPDVVARKVNSIFTFGLAGDR